MGFAVATRVLVSVTALSLVGVCAGELVGEPPELSLMHGAQPQFLFASHAAATNQRDAMGLRGPVKNIELRFEQTSEAEPGEVHKQPGGMRMDFDAEGSLIGMRRIGDPDGEPMSAEWEIVRKELGGASREVERSIKPGASGGLINSALLEYDSAGSVVKITTRGAIDHESVTKIERAQPGGPVAAVETSEEGRALRREYDEQGRLLKVESVGPGDERTEIVRLTWDKDGGVRCERAGGHLFFEGSIDAQGAFTRYTLDYGGRTIRFVRTAERDQHGNWTSLATTMSSDGPDGKPAPGMTTRWVRVIEYWGESAVPPAQ